MKDQRPAHESLGEGLCRVVSTGLCLSWWRPLLLIVHTPGSHLRRCPINFYSGLTLNGKGSPCLRQAHTEGLSRWLLPEVTSEQGPEEGGGRHGWVVEQGRRKSQVDADG